MSEYEILIVEDSLTQSLKLQHLLKQRGYQVTVARNGQEALAALEQRLPAVVLSEIVMPDMDGYQLCRQIKAQSGQDVVVILLNSFSDPRGVLKTLECGADNWLPKPYDEQSLVSMLNDLRANQTRWMRETSDADTVAVFQGEQLALPAVSPSTLIALLLSTYRTAVQRTRELREVTRALELLEEQWETLKQAGESPATEVPTTPESLPPLSESSRQLHILLAEDSAVNQRFALRILEKYGHTVVVAGNGKEALKALEQESFDLVLMDVEMPELGGCETAAAIRRQELTTHAHLPIFAMTAHTEPEELERCLASGMDDYVAKPLQASELNRVIERVTAMASPPPMDDPLAETARETEPEQEEAAEMIYDREAAMSLVDDDLELLQEIAQLFLEESPRQMEQIRQAIIQKDAPALERAAHTLKGAAASISAPAVRAAALALETMGRDNDLSHAEAAGAALEEALEALKPVLASIGNE